MRILYGVQGTGNGHITRARMMAEALRQLPVDVDYVFSGKDDTYFNMEPFANYRKFAGLSFVAQQGKIRYLGTLRRNNLKRFVDDVRSINVTDYDLVLNDFEPITAWAARLNKVPSIGLSHQNAFRFRVPVRGNNPIAAMVLRWFAPANINVGFHWHHFNQPILPPMIKTDLPMQSAHPGKVLVYLPFLPHDHFHRLFNRFPDHQFVQYHPVEHARRIGNVDCNPLSREGFMQDFSDCSGIICSAGFGACSEAIHYGKKLLVLPLQGQMEQLSNAAALERLGYGTIVSASIRKGELREWLEADTPPAMCYPNVADALAQWVANGQTPSLQELSRRLWQSVDLPPIPTKPFGSKQKPAGSKAKNHAARSTLSWL